MKIVYISVQSMDAKNMELPVRNVAEENGWDVDIYCVNANEVDDDPLVYHELVRRTSIAYEDRGPDSDEMYDRTGKDEEVREVRTGPEGVSRTRGDIRREHGDPPDVP